ncbi:MAG: FAD-binding oxidoreductase, partial [Rikenellaceae bacterium]|nr:FAD-binding oxidoreductase [Rikenellaceae bacterium]
MDLYSGLPWWAVKNPLYDYFNPLTADYRTNVAIVGGGITGALAAHELCRAGIRCCVVDKWGSGSSRASTALLQYEIDTPLCELTGMVGREGAVTAYRACLQSIGDLEKVFRQTGCDVGWRRVPSLWYAPGRRGRELLEKEYEARCEARLPVAYLSRLELRRQYGFRAYGALENDASAQMDSYAGACGLIDHHLCRGELKVFTHTEVAGYREKPDRIELRTAEGHRIS